MNRESSQSRNKRDRCAALLLSILLFLQTTAAVGDALTPVPCSTAPVRRGADPVLVAGAVGRAFSYVETALSNRRRMIQLATLGMCIGLYILMRR
jgi:hypothetical protein